MRVDFVQIDTRFRKLWCKQASWLHVPEECAAIVLVDI